MKGIGILMLALAVVAGCRSIPEQVSVPTDAGTKLVAVKDLSDEQKVALLRTEAKKRGMRWEIFCIPKSDYLDHRYQAEAFQPGDKSEESRYAEDGAKDWWAKQAPTPGEAAYLLYQAILEGPANHSAWNKPLDLGNPSDCNYNVVLDSKHPNNIPCVKK